MLAAGHIKIARRGHKLQIPIQTLIVQYNIPDLISAVCRMVDLGDDGTTMQSRWDYSLESLTSHFNVLDVWTSFQVTIPGFNEFYPPETKVVRCKPADKTTMARFQPVLVLLYPNAVGIHRE
jgi:hypothetical protein